MNKKENGLTKNVNSPVIVVVNKYEVTTIRYRLCFWGKGFSHFLNIYAN